MDLPLSPYRVLDLTSAIGFLCGKILGDLGADIIKIERPGGDPSRNIGPFYHDNPHPEKSLFWFAYNTSKKGITLDIGIKDGQEIFKRLVETADFVIESFHPGYMDSLGLGYQALSKINTRIIVTSISPFGQTGPYRDYEYSDIVLTAMSGVMSVCGDYDRPPLRCSEEQAMLLAGAHAAVGTLIAHHYRQVVGEGQQVNIPARETICMLPLMPFWNVGGKIWRRDGAFIAREAIKRRNIFSCKDGNISWQILLGTLGAKTSSLVKWMDEEGVAGDLKEIDWETTDMDKLSQQQIAAWEELFQRFFLLHTKSELYKGAIERGITLCQSNDISDILHDKQLIARDFWTNVEHPEMGISLKYPGSPFKSNKPSWRISRRAPLVGEHNVEVYERGLGMTREDLITLKQAKVI